MIPVSISVTDRFNNNIQKGVSGTIFKTNAITTAVLHSIPNIQTRR